MTSHLHISLLLLSTIVISSSCKQSPAIQDCFHPGHEDEVRDLIKSGKGINEHDYWANTPLRLASINGSKALAEALLMNGLISMPEHTRAEHHLC